MSRFTAFLRRLVGRERLPHDEAPAPVNRRGFLRTLTARENLPRDEAPGLPGPRSLLRWLMSFERLPEDSAAPPTGGDGASGDRRARREGEP
jgi:hypothetical protein